MKTRIPSPFTVIYLLIFISTFQSALSACSNECTLEILDKDVPHTIKPIDIEACKSMEFQKSAQHSLSEFYMTSFASKKTYRSYSLINMTFVNPKWHYLKMRIKPRGEGKTFCQELTLKKGIQFEKNFAVNLNCPRYCNDNQVLDVEYFCNNDAKEEGRHFVTKIPSLLGIGNDTKFERWKVFSYVDETDIPSLTVYWQNARSDFKVESYIVSLLNVETKKIAHSEEIRADNSKKRMSAKFTEWTSGKYQFVIQPINVNRTKGYSSTSGEVWITFPSAALPVIIASVVSLVIMVLVVLCVSLLIFCLPDKIPVVLMVYERTRQTHLDAMVALAEFLRTSCQIDARIDEMHVRLTEHMDPFDWCQEAFFEADAVMVLSSPPPSVLGHEVGAYRRLGGVGLNLLREHHYRGDRRFCTVLLPYCNEEDIPPAARNLRRFSLLAEMDEMIWYLRETSTFSKLCRFRWIPKSKSRLGLQDRRLVDAFNRAIEDVNELNTPSVRPIIVNDMSRIGAASLSSDEGNIPQVLPPDEIDDVAADELAEVLSEREHLQQLLNTSNAEASEDRDSNEGSSFELQLH